MDSGKDDETGYEFSKKRKYSKIRMFIFKIK